MHLFCCAYLISFPFVQPHHSNGEERILSYFNKYFHQAPPVYTAVIEPVILSAPSVAPDSSNDHVGPIPHIFLLPGEKEVTRAVAHSPINIMYYIMRVLTIGKFTPCHEYLLVYIPYRCSASS
jgi:hypothetical protein